MTVSEVAQHLSGTLQGWVNRHRVDAAATPVRAPSGARIRPRKAHDVGACSRLLVLVSSRDGYPLPRPESLRHWLTDEEVLDVWVAELHGEILGHVALSQSAPDVATAMRWREVTGRPPSELVCVSRLFVRERVRRQGIATALVEAAVGAAHERGLLPVAEVVSSSRQGAPLFESLGWRLAAQLPWGARQDGLHGYRYLAPQH